MRDRATAILSTIVVDDEQLACDELSFLLKDFPEVEIIATGSNGLEAVEIIQQLEPELVFLDVNMPGLDGMGVVRRLRENGAVLPHFIFLSDFHIDKMDGLMEVLVPVLANLRPDLCVMTGDYRYEINGPYDEVYPRMSGVLSKIHADRKSVA